MPEPVLSIRDLTVEFSTEDGIVKAVTDVTYDLFPGEVLGVVGESGSGKSVSVMSMLGLIPAGRVVKGEALYKGRDLLRITVRNVQALAVLFERQAGRKAPRAHHAFCRAQHALAQLSKRGAPVLGDIDAA